MHRSNIRPRSSALILGALVVAALCGLAPRASRAQIIRPWSPPSQDSLLAWSAESKVRFQENQGDSATGPNYQAYYLVGNIGRHLLRSMGRGNAAQAPAIKGVLDSLGVDADVAIDPAHPEFVLIMVRNPSRMTANAVGFMYWYRGDDLRIQGIIFEGQMQPSSRIWWTGRDQAPYEWGILSRERGADGRAGLMLLRLDPDGYYWKLVQYEHSGPDLGDGQAFWVDVNGDQQPEIVSWVRAHADSSFTECAACPHLLTERIYVEREFGFDIEDSRLLPSPYSTFVLFIRLLRDKNRAAASRLLSNPALIDRAIAAGWGAPSAPGQWRLDYVGSDELWPDRLAMHFNGGKGKPLYAVSFEMKDARWVIKNWVIPTAKGAPADTLPPAPPKPRPARKRVTHK